MTTEISSDSAFFNITPAALSDASSIANLGSTVWTAAFAWSVADPADAVAYTNTYYTTEAWEKELVDPTSDTYVARSVASPSTVLGFVQIKRGTVEPCLKEITGPMVELHRIYVDGKTHGKGIGKALLSFADKKARADGNEYIWLGVWESNKEAFKLYQRMGYERKGEHSFAIGGEIQTDWVMIKKL